MSGKSKRRGRHLSRSQRKRLGRAVSTPAASTTPTPAPTTSAPAAGAAVPPREETPVAAKATARTLTPSTNVSGELKRIGLVGGIIVAMLVAAYFVLPSILD
jgi:hypothetical protein